MLEVSEETSAGGTLEGVVRLLIEIVAPMPKLRQVGSGIFWDNLFRLLRTSGNRATEAHASYYYKAAHRI